MPGEREEAASVEEALVRHPRPWTWAVDDQGHAYVIDASMEIVARVSGPCAQWAAQLAASAAHEVARGEWTVEADQALLRWLAGLTDTWWDRPCAVLTNRQARALRSAWRDAEARLLRMEQRLMDEVRAHQATAAEVRRA